MADSLSTTPVVQTALGTGRSVSIYAESITTPLQLDAPGTVGAAGAAGQAGHNGEHVILDGKPHILPGGDGGAGGPGSPGGAGGTVVISYASAAVGPTASVPGWRGRTGRSRGGRRQRRPAGTPWARRTGRASRRRRDDHHLPGALKRGLRRRANPGRLAVVAVPDRGWHLPVPALRRRRSVARPGRVRRRAAARFDQQHCRDHARTGRGPRDAERGFAGPRHIARLQGHLRRLTRRGPTGAVGVPGLAGNRDPRTRSPPPPRTNCSCQ